MLGVGVRAGGLGGLELPHLCEIGSYTHWTCSLDAPPLDAYMT